MREDKEVLATQRLLETIRGESRLRPPIAGHDRTIDDSPTSTGADVHSIHERVILTRPIKPRLWNRNRVKVGLDVGHQAVKMVMLERFAGGFRLLQLGMAEIRPVPDSPDDLVDAQVRASRNLFKDIHTRKTFFVTSLSGPGIIIRQFTLPRMPAKELAQTIPFESRKHVPYDPSKVVLRYQILSGQRKSPNLQVLLTAVPKEALQRHLEMLGRLDIEPSAIEVGPLALANAYLRWSKNIEETAILLDIGASGTLIDIHREGSMFFCRHLSVSMEHFIHRMRDRFGLPLEEAALIARGESLPAAPASDELGEAFQPVMEELLSEVRRSLAYYDYYTGRLGFSRVFVTGGGALLPGLLKSLEENLQLQVEVLDPFRGIHWEEASIAQDWIERLRPLWAGAVGLATRP